METNAVGKVESKPNALFLSSPFWEADGQPTTAAFCIGFQSESKAGCGLAIQA